MEQILLNDTSVLLNLLATGRIKEIASALQVRLALCARVKAEAKFLRDVLTGEMIPVEIDPLIAAGLLTVLDFESEAEQSRFVDAAAVVDDGEAMSIALAVSRKLTLATDDKKAVNYVRATFPNLELTNTPAILKHWSEAPTVRVELLSTAIRDIESKTRYFPHHTHPLRVWWESSKRLPH
jgi:predicted nucleic acid-binding protein